MSFSNEFSSQSEGVWESSESLNFPSLSPTSSLDERFSDDSLGPINSSDPSSDQLNLSSPYLVTDASSSRDEGEESQIDTMLSSIISDMRRQYTYKSPPSLHGPNSK